MKVLYCNKYNFPFSGTEVYLFEVMEMMRARGHDVTLFSMADPRGAAGPYDQHLVPHIDFKSGGDGLRKRIGLAAHAIYSVEARRRMGHMIEEFRPDVAHVRNIYHHLSPSILWELKARGIPVLYHVNDFKLLCPSYNMVARGLPCEDCRQGAFWSVVTKGCYAGGRWQAIVLAAEAYLHRWLGTYRNCVDHFLTPSRFVKDRLVESGFEAGRISVLPHFQMLPEQADAAGAHAPILYFGRLSPEKGVADLVCAMCSLPDIRLQIAGDGPQRAALEQQVRDLGLGNVEFLGHVDGAALHRLISAAQFTVLPSRAYETMGKSILESYAWARPVIASDLGSRRELVREGETGFLFQAGDVQELAAAISFLANRPTLARQMGLAGRELVRQHHSPDAHYVALTRVYERLALQSRSASRTRSWKTPTSAPSLRIAFIGGRGVISKYSGIETYYEEVGSQLVAMGHEVTLYCRTYFTPQQGEFRGMHLVRLPTIRTKHLETLVHTWLSTIHVMFSRCQIVHYHALGPALFSFLPRLVGKKTAVTIQGLDWQRKKWGLTASTVLHLGEWAAVHFPNATMTVSQTLHHRLRLRFHAESIYVPNGTRLRQPGPVSHLEQWNLKPGEYVLFLGRFSPEKNCHLLIEAFEKVPGPVRLVLAGGSSHSSVYVNELRRHQSERIRFLDWVSGDALDALTTHAMLFVMPSDLEGLSLALLDAMGAGVCVLASDVPENRELVEGVGFTFRPGDVHDLQHMLQFLISDPMAREAAAGLARQRIRERYLWPGIAAQVEAVYWDVVGRPLAAMPSRGPQKKNTSAA